MAVPETKILAFFDDAVSSGYWPGFESEGDVPETVYHALRLIAACDATTDAFGVIFECVSGVSEEASYVHRYVHGSARGHSDRWDELGLFTEDTPADLDESEIAGCTIVGPAGPMVLPADAVQRFDLRPEWIDEGGWGYDDGRRFPLFIRAYLAAHPRAFWGDENALVQEWLGFAGAPWIMVSEAFEHVVGPDGAAGDARWRRMPSLSPTYISLARAIHMRSVGAFVAGPSNLDWRLHGVTA